MSEAVEKSRREFRNIHITQIVQYRLPLAGLISILHRISGFLMFLLLPFVLYLLDKSLTSEISFEHFKGIASHWFVKLVLLGLVWAYLHHFSAGLRHLLLDTHVGLDKNSARKTAAGVLAFSLVLTALIALKLFGAF
ncbi:succinate dehydrogenase, cytochrome b556 subunit [Noviherbaspirillum massiliense]|uniref:succinate dehydrogenase, cytochrome b556 subunit n=1 Tax=Noviherbaspirillum massiliense TaxID=1465823 RepID=UPI0002F27A37|nr:succinate dehydrogenase, cytochrome b556 subunit [Noviherbaspirillum massiliense]